MDRVLDRLWIGATEDFRAPLKALGFVAALDLRDLQPTGLDVAVLHVGNRDGDAWSPKQVKDALDFVADHIRRGRVLVACMAGMSRSASMIIGFLVRSGWDEASAYEAVWRVRPKIAPVPVMLASVLEAVKL
jgi:protein-tyrosine phosphatase